MNVTAGGALLRKFLGIFITSVELHNTENSSTFALQPATVQFGFLMEKLLAQLTTIDVNDQAALLSLQQAASAILQAGGSTAPTPSTELDSSDVSVLTEQPLQSQNSNYATTPLRFTLLWSNPLLYQPASGAPIVFDTIQWKPEMANLLRCFQVR